MSGTETVAPTVKPSKSPDVTPPQADVESWEEIAEDVPTQKESPKEKKGSPPSAANRPTETAGESSDIKLETGSLDGPRQDTVDSNDKAPPTNASTNSTRTPKHKEDGASSRSVKSVVPPPKTVDEKENVNIVFIGHVGKLKGGRMRVLLFLKFINSVLWYYYIILRTHALHFPKFT